ncbi:adenylate/guanylate cyclase domain-containing protein [Alteraurantiacibacter aestuarii]|uniref:adenylate/guanylate cyclase domain-containing protein n=1 Tax=Alteraurantiacibacter aestuarii TaxID=650004 RepID=UPI001F2484DE|nr:adenylate/guanylate cyclase domain-containing protein [Alteraurantiacibacter aestuarii]
MAITVFLLIAALILARFSWNLPFTDNAERALYDYRSYILAEQVEQDDRVLMIVYDDQTLINLRKRSPLDRGLLARALRNIDGMGAKAIGIDILFDQPQDEDGELIDALRSMNTPVSIAYAETATNSLDIQYQQQQFLDEFMAQLEGSNAYPASVRLAESSGVTRVWPTIEEGLPPLLGRSMVESNADDAHLAMPGYEGAIRYRKPALVDRPVFTTLQIDLFANDELLAIPEVRAPLEEQVNGAYVLLGGDIIDYDRALTPLSGFDDDAVAGGARDVRPPGIEIHAHTIAQMLDGARLPHPSPLFLWFFAGVVVLAAGLTALLEVKSWKFIPLLVAQLALFIGLPFFLHARGVDTYLFPSIGPALGWVLAFSAVVSAARAAGAVQRKFAQGALGKYLPQSIAEEIIEKPELLALGGAKREIYVIFSDLEGFTKMSHAIEPEMVAKLLNRYLEMLSAVVLDHGGILDKFVGDAVVAFWGAPIARPDDADRAAQAGYAMWQAGETFRQEVAAMDPDLPKIGKTRVGMHFGEAVVGNFGGENRIQYTALGDSMNTAARLESANKALKTSVMASQEIASRTSLDWWRPMGSVVLSGRSSPVALFEPAPDFPREDREALAEALEMVVMPDSKAAGLAMLEEISARHPDDEGLRALIERSHNLNEAGAHVLAGK